MGNWQRARAASLALLVVTGLARAEDLKLYTFPSAPYQVVGQTLTGQGSAVTGLTVDTVACSAARAGKTARIYSSPPKRAVQFLIDNLIDGYFAVDPSRALDQIAFRTHPIALEKWHLISLADAETPENPRIGAVIGSNEEAWLRARGKNIFLTVQAPEQLIALLQRHRIDQALMDQRVLELLSNTGELSSHFLRYVPLHAYFSHGFVDRNPDFIATFNRQIPSCVNQSFDLDDAETSRIRATAYDLFQEIQAQVQLTTAIKAGPNIRSLAEILNLDAQWQALAPLYHSDMARRVADQPVSKVLSEWQRQHQPLVTEVLLTNSIGTLVAMSRLTSDFWQGDEPKFEHHIRGGPRSLYVSPIRYDASTSRFQVMVSMPVMVADRWLPAGVLAIGLDIETALAGEHHFLNLP